MTDAKGAAQLEQLPLLRINHEADMVGFMPSAPWKDLKHGQWAHAGKAILLIDEDRINRPKNALPSEEEQRRFCQLTGTAASAWYMSSFWQQQYLGNLGSHRMASYVAEVCSRCKQAKGVKFNQRHEPDLKDG